MNILRPHRPGFRAVLLFLALVLLAAPSYAGTIEVAFDIHPTSCPNPFNPGSLLRGGTFPTAILGSDDLDVSNIALSGLVIVVPDGGGEPNAAVGGEILVPPISTSQEDVATPVADNTNCACTTDGPDGYDDLIVHFDHDAIAAALGSVAPGDEFVLCIRGFLLDGTPFEGCDCIFIVGPTSADASSWGKVKATYRD